MTESKKNNGIFFALISALLWGSYPVWYGFLRGISATDVLAFRVIGSYLFALMFIIVLKSVSFTDIKQLLTKKITIIVLFFSSIVTAVWWLSYIYAVANNLVLEASLGYFISPIVSVFFGFIIFGERPKHNQWLAIIITFSAIGYMIFDYGKTPWIAIVIGVCFSSYAAIRKGQAIKALPGLGIECLFLLPFALAFLIYQTMNNGVVIYASINPMQWLVLAVIGLISVLPLWWYTIAAQKLEMITLSFFQLIPPICNFIFAVYLFNEALTSTHLITFGLIWLASICYFYDRINLLKINRLQKEKTV